MTDTQYEAIKTHLTSRLGDLIKSVNPVNGYTPGALWVVCNVLDRHNDYMTPTIIWEHETWCVSDEGSILADVDAAGVTIDRPALHRMIADCGAYIETREIRCAVQKTGFPRALLTVLQAMIAVDAVIRYRLAQKAAKR